ncbi:MAG: 3-methyl-2-oxobutanoate hydroxymethyltransferase [Promethearchaeota archaeon]|nr:MAG: 3-methyl-2-oxobutanoate hydroxymethyltransferase [Candidatus Lokiarchaeota archaeon]
MSLQKVTIKNIIEKKKKGEKIISITSYDYSFAKIVDDCNFDIILVGDSLAMVVLGYENTLSVTMNEMIHHTKAVSRGVSNALLVGDMPYLSYKVDRKDALYNAGRFIQEAGAEAVKVEGGTEICSTIRAMIEADIQVMGHIGLTPQSIYKFGGFMVQGKTTETAKKLILDAINLENTGVFSIVLESIPWQIAKLITETVNIPTIGIGAGIYCDGQILVINDMLALYKEIKPKFLKYFGEIGSNVREALNKYKSEVVAQEYPTTKLSYEFPENELNQIHSWFENADLEEEAKKLGENLRKRK